MLAPTLAVMREAAYRLSISLSWAASAACGRSAVLGPEDGRRPEVECVYYESVKLVCILASTTITTS